MRVNFPQDSIGILYVYLGCRSKALITIPIQEGGSKKRNKIWLFFATNARIILVATNARMIFDSHECTNEFLIRAFVAIA